MEDYVSFEQAKALKELGFNWTSYNYYDDDRSLITTSHDEYYSEFKGRTTAPTLSQAQKWLREIHKLDCNANCDPYCLKWFWYVFSTIKSCEGINQNENFFDTYEEALSESIDKAIEIIKKKEKLKSWKTM